MENSSVRFINLQILRQLVKSKRMKLTDIMIIPDSIYIIIGEVDPWNDNWLLEHRFLNSIGGVLEDIKNIKQTILHERVCRTN